MPRPSGELFPGELAGTTGSAADGFDQRFGIPAAAGAARGR